MSLYAADGSINVTIVDGSTYTGLYAPDGSWNVITDGSQGLYHPCGAYRVTIVSGSEYTGIQAADGSWNAVVAESDGLQGGYHPCGAIRMTGLDVVLALSPFAYYDPSDIDTLFQDAAMTVPVTADSDPVGAILDKSGNGNHLTQSTAGARPLYKTSGGLSWLEFDGTDDFLSKAYSSSLSQPWERISAVRVLTHTNGDRIFSCVNNDNGALIMDILTTWSISSGTQLFFTAPTVDTDVVFTERHNGLSSRVAINNDPYTTGDAGSNDTGGLRLASQWNDSSFGNIRFYGGAIFSNLLSDEEISTVRGFFTVTP